MKPLALRCALAIFTALIVAMVLNSWLFGEHSEGGSTDIQEASIASATLEIKSKLGADTAIPLKLIKQLEKKHALNISVLKPEELTFYDIKESDWQHSSPIEFLDEDNNYGELLLLDEESSLAIEIWSDPPRVSLLAQLLEVLLPVLIQMLCVSCALLWATHSEKMLLEKIRTSVYRWNRGEQVHKLHSKSSGLAGEISTELDDLLDYFHQINLSRNDLEVSHQDLLHGVAHEFRSPMARLSFAVEMLAESDPKKHPENLHQNIHNSLDEMEQLVKEVLQYSRLQYGGKPLDFVFVNVSVFVQSVISKQKIITPEIVFETQGNDQKVRVIAHLFDRALLNLVRNASRFAQRTVLISWQAGDNEFILSVSDDGIGIPPGKRERIFEPFTRLDASRSRDSGGVGLGLSIVKSICTKHNGSVEVDTSLLGGAKFSIRIPQVQGHQEEAAV